MKNYKRYLLYIDILGYSELARTDPSSVASLHTIVDGLGSHRHGLFRTVIFSDRILVYNRKPPVSRADREDLVTCACRMARDLVYGTIGHDLYFRAVLRYGEFDHYQLQNVECYYGMALIFTYFKDKDIGATGLFIDNNCQLHNHTFPVTRYDDELSFVYLNRGLEAVAPAVEGIEAGALNDGGGEQDVREALRDDVRMLADVHHRMTAHPIPAVRAKFLATWQFFKGRYPKLLDILEQASFRPEAVTSALQRESTSS